MKTVNAQPRKMHPETQFCQQYRGTMALLEPLGGSQAKSRGSRSETEAQKEGELPQPCGTSVNNLSCGSAFVSDHPSRVCTGHIATSKCASHPFPSNDLARWVPLCDCRHLDYVEDTETNNFLPIQHLGRGTAGTLPLAVLSLSHTAVLSTLVPALRGGGE